MTLRAKLAAVAGGLLVACTILLAGLYAFLGSGPGLDFLMRQIEQVARDEGVVLEIGQVTGHPLSTLTIGRLAASDGKGRFLAAEGATFDWRPWALFGRTVEIGVIRIGRVVLDRIPDLPKADREPRAKTLSRDEPFDIGADFILRELRVVRLELGDDVLGTRQEFRFSASADVVRDGSRARVDATLRAVGAGTDTAKIGVDFATKPARFALVANIDEPAGGPLARLAGLPPGTRLVAKIDGRGPPDNWRGHLTAAIGDMGTADLAVTVGIKESHAALGLTGSVNPGGVLPAELRPLVASGIGLKSVLRFEPGKTIMVDSLAAQSAAGKLDASGRVALSDGALKATVKFEAVSGGPLAALIAPAALGSAVLKAEIGGTVVAPQIDAEFSARDVVAGGTSMGTIRATAKVTLSASGSPEAVVQATAANVVVDGVPAGLLSETAELRFRASADPGGSVSVPALALRAGAIGLDADGKVDVRGAVAMNYRIAVDDIAPALRYAGVALSGRAAVSGTATYQPGDGAVRATVSGRLEQLRSPDAVIGSLLGLTVPLSATVAFRKGSLLDIAGLEVTPAFGRLHLKGQVDTGTGLVSARLDAAAPALAKVSKLAGVPLTGSARLAINVTGALSAPLIRARLSTAALTVSGESVEALGIGAGLQFRADGAAGSVKLQGVLRKRPVGSSFALRLTGDRLALSDIKLSLGNEAMTGNATLNLRRGSVRGRLEGAFADIGPLAALAGFDVSGRAAVRAGFTDGDAKAGQGATLVAELSELALPGGARVGRAVLSARMGDILRRQSLVGTLDLERLVAADARVNKAKIAVRGSFSGASWTIDGDGAWRGALAVKAAGQVARSGAATEISVASLSGKAVGEPILLREPLRVRLVGESIETGPVALEFAGGALNGQVRWSAGAVDANLAARGFPAELVALAAPGVSLSGKLSGDLKVSGAPSRPEINATVGIAELRPTGVAEGNDVRFQGRATLKQAADGIAISLDFRGSGETRLAFDARSSATLSLTTGEIAGGATAAISGKLAASGRLDLVDRMVGLGGDRLNGRLNADVTLGGTLGRPDLRGHARVEDGYYEGVATGIVLRNAKARLVLDGDRVNLEALSAEDGDGGSVTGTGSFLLADLDQAGLTLVFKNLRVLRRPEVDAQVSGKLEFGGGLARPALKGALTVDRAEIRIPDRLPQSVVALDVVEIHGNGTQRQTSDAPDPSLGKALKIALDLSVDIPHKTFVRGRGLDSEWAGKLRIRGDSAQPKITGTLSVVRGKFAFAGKSFNLSKGKVFFRPETTEPEIDAVAEATIGDITAKIGISGKASAPDLTVSSTPPLPQEDVLSRILFGKTAGQLSALQAAQLAQTALTLSGKTGGLGIMDKIRSALGVDVLDVSAGEGSDRGASLKAGKYIRDDVFLSVRQGTEPGSQRVGVEVEVLPNISVESDIGASADSNVGIKWKWDY